MQSGHSNRFQRTVREVADGQLRGRVCKKLQCHLWLPFPDHEVDDNERLEDNGPC